LCGHATLATAHVLFNELGDPSIVTVTSSALVSGNSNRELRFETLWGQLAVRKDVENLIRLDFPQYEINSVKSPLEENRLAGHFFEIPASQVMLDLVKVRPFYVLVI
jgi:predicted PhzF superfamily epimerase YddE/YHI9